MFPNPSKGDFNLIYKGEHLDNVTMTITDITGQELMRKDIQLETGFTEEIKMTNLQTGIYFINLNKDGVFLDSEKIIIQH